MRLDEKTVINYVEAAASPADKEGYLYKKGEIKTSYQKRWCVLKGNLLFYKERPSDRDVIGVIVLEGCTVQLCESDEQFAFSLVWSEPGLRTYKFAAASQASQESWIKALLPATHRYLALLVMDMEKKYRETLSALSMEQANAFDASILSTSAKHPGSVHSARMSKHHSQPVVADGAGSSLVPQPVTVSPRPTHKRSPKLWSRRTVNAASVRMEGQDVTLGTREEFTKLHEDFGKEVRELIAEWSKQGQGGAAIQEENLIDFG